MATVKGGELFELIVDGGESAKNQNRPGLQRLLKLVDSDKVNAVIVAKLDRLTRSVKDLRSLLALFEKRSVALVSVAESLDTASAAGRLVITILAAVSQWEREAVTERTDDASQHKRSTGERVGNIRLGFRLNPDAKHVEPDTGDKACSLRSVICARAATRCEGLRPPQTSSRCGPAVARRGGWSTCRESSNRQPALADPEKRWDPARCLGGQVVFV